MDFLEKDLEEIIFNSSKKSLSDRGLFITGGKFYRQLSIGNYGRADLVSFYRDESMVYITVTEIKKDKIGISAFLQAIGYARGIQRYINKRKPHMNISINIVLIGREIDKNSTFSYLPSVLPYMDYDMFLTCYTYRYDLDGLYFKEEDGYCLIDEGF